LLAGARLALRQKRGWNYPTADKSQTAAKWYSVVATKVAAATLTLEFVVF
jgi:hypothetical protein